jgi:hypothetical protein
MPKLRYKDHHDKKEKKSNRGSSQHKHSKHKKKRKEEPYYKPPILFEEEQGWIPPPQRIDEAEWREHLFEAMMDDEGQDPFYSRYEHSQPTPNDKMTDEEYRQHIVDGMYKRTHKEEIEAEEKRKAQKEKKRKEKEEAKAKLEKENAERIRIQNVYSQLEELKKRSASREAYLEKWKKLEAGEGVIYAKKDIPWPILGKLSFDTVKAFMIDLKATPNENKKNVRKEQTRYHPDKFITKYMSSSRFKGTEKEKRKILTQINELSGILNQLWADVNT